MPEWRLEKKSRVVSGSSFEIHEHIPNPDIAAPKLERGKSSTTRMQMGVEDNVLSKNRGACIRHQTLHRQLGRNIHLPNPATHSTNK
jgi:hypothetical protein